MRVIPSSRGARSATRSQRFGPPWTHGSPPVSRVRIRSPDEPTNGRVATPDKALGKSVAGLDMPSCWRTHLKGASPMQAYCVSKRPPRALYLGLAIALGMVAVSTVVLSQMGGGLLRDGTYLRLLGYSPSNRGASLTALGAVDAGASRGVLSASSAPGPTPAPPRAEVAQGPSDAPANATPAPAASSDRNPDLVHADVPALRELNETSRDLANGSLDSFGLGVLPRDADQVRGAPDLTHFIVPSSDDGNCTWTKEFTATDAHHDGTPEYVDGRMLVTCLLDANQNGIPEARVTLAQD